MERTHDDDEVVKSSKEENIFFFLLLHVHVQAFKFKKLQWQVNICNIRVTLWNKVSV